MLLHICYCLDAVNHLPDGSKGLQCDTKRRCHEKPLELWLSQKNVDEHDG